MIYTSNDKIISGLNKQVDLVELTYGPKGSNVVLDEVGVPTITNDGISIAKRVKFKNKLENIGAKFGIEVAERQNDMAGDGRTTALILTREFVKAGYKLIKNGRTPISVYNDIKDDTEAVRGLLAGASRKIKQDEIAKIAELSCESKELGNIIASVLKKLGKDSVITVEESPTYTTEQEIVKGMNIGSGFISPVMATKDGKAEYKNVHILITDYTLTGAEHIGSLMERLNNDGKNTLVVIAEKTEGDALTTMVVNKLQGRFNTLAINAPGFGENKKEILKDIATLCGATLVSKDNDIKLEDIKIEHLGIVNVVSNKKSTILTGSGNVKERIKDRIKEIKAGLKIANGFEKTQLEERLAKLSNGVAVIRVGASTEAELKYKKKKLEDGINATKSAMEEGIVRGGGVALAEIANTKLKVISSAIKKPNELIKKQVKIENDVYDSLKVVRLALENALSMAGIVLTIKGAIVEDDKL